MIKNSVKWLVFLAVAYKVALLVLTWLDSGGCGVFEMCGM